MSVEFGKPADKRAKREVATRSLVSINPFFIVEKLQASIAYYVERLGFQLDFQGPPEGPYYGRVSRGGPARRSIHNVADRPTHPFTLPVGVAPCFAYD